MPTKELKDNKATLTYKDKTVDMDDKKAAEEVISDMLIEKFPEFKGDKKMAEIKADLKNIRNVEIKSKVVDVKDSDPKVVTVVKFEYDGEPSEVEEILMLEAQSRPIHASIYSPQLAMDIGDKPE